MLLCLLKNTIGSDKHFLYDTDNKKCSFVSNILPDAWVYGDPYSSKNNINALLNLTGKKNINSIFPKEYINMMKIVMYNIHNEEIEWKKVLPPDIYKTSILNAVECLVSDLKDLNTSYYSTTFKRTIEALEALEPAFIDTDRLHKYLALETETNQKTLISSFSPGAEKKDFAKQVKYDQFSSTTGRLVVRDGPRILNIKKEYRNILVSRYGDKGKIIELDFRSLEPRFFSIIANKSHSEEDIYSTISKEVFNDAFSRKIVKGACLAAQYGMSAHTLKNKLNIEDLDANEIIKKIRDYFSIDQLARKLLKEVEKTGAVKNYFGRIIKIGDVKNISPYTLVNYYIQSSSVDIALLGFNNIINYIKENKLLIYPIFVLHDAILLDCNINEEHNIENLKNVGSNIKEFDNIKFWIKNEIII